MKRTLSILLVLLILLLCGCQQETAIGLSILTGNTETDVHQWSEFYYSPYLDPSREASIGLSNGCTLCWNGSEYTITNDRGTHSYSHLVYLPCVEEAEGGWYYRNEFVLTDNASLTREEFLETGIGELVYVDAAFCKSAPIFGEAPDAVTNLIQRRMDSFLLSEYMHNSLFKREISGSMEDRQEVLRRWDHNGNLLCEIHVDGYSECFAELEDGGFLATLHNYGRGTYQVICYNSEGSIRWEVSLGDAELPDIKRIIVTPDGIYGFGTIRQEARFQDLYICHVSADGKLAQEVCLGGTDYDTIDWVEVSAEGISVYGSTQSNDGDFPFSKEGYGVDFLLSLSLNLEILSVTQEDHDRSYFDVEGYLDGAPVFYGDDILAVSKKDNLPTDNIISNAVYPYGAGYVVLRTYKFGSYPYQLPTQSYQSSYMQIIATGYDSEGNPLWQTVSEPYIC